MHVIHLVSKQHLGRRRAICARPVTGHGCRRTSYRNNHTTGKRRHRPLHRVRTVAGSKDAIARSHRLYICCKTWNPAAPVRRGDCACPQFQGRDCGNPRTRPFRQQQSTHSAYTSSGKAGRTSSMYRDLYSRLDAVIFVSDLARKEFLSSNPPIDREKLHVVHNSIASPRATSLPEDISRTDLPVIMHHGRISPEKGLDVLFDALSTPYRPAMDSSYSRRRECTKCRPAQATVAAPRDRQPNRMARLPPRRAQHHTVSLNRSSTVDMA